MNVSHELSRGEQAVLDSLLERFRFTPVSVRLSSTMLDKSIIDARGAIQAYLARTGIIEYSAIGQGPDHKLQIEFPFVSGQVSERRKISFYRPNTKQGDPRFWVERLGSTAEAGDVLVLAFSGTDLVLIHLVGTVEGLSRGLNGLLPSTFEERGELESVVRRLTTRLGPLAKEWIPSGRAGPTAARGRKNGKTRASRD